MCEYLEVLVSLVRGESGLRRQSRQLRDIGVTDVNAAISGVEEGSYQRTMAFLPSELVA